MSETMNNPKVEQEAVPSSDIAVLQLRVQELEAKIARLESADSNSGKL